ncbi:hypothetical protein CHARACLAT_003406 [Characodon lateralis]|uniref:Uncharacterized protein n=1 Tax=Characodon lateralis TaxID=208331 RepID=A0ABU7DZ24_9TELE|nr:hypothetical protein [Characodon lateralis]
MGAIFLSLEREELTAQKMSAQHACLLKNTVSVCRGEPANSNVCCLSPNLYRDCFTLSTLTLSCHLIA